MYHQHNSNKVSIKWDEQPLSDHSYLLKTITITEDYPSKGNQYNRIKENWRTPLLVIHEM